MAQWLMTHTALAEALSSVLSAVEGQCPAYFWLDLGPVLHPEAGTHKLNSGT